MVWAPNSVIHERYRLLALQRDRPGHQVWLALDESSETQVILKSLSFTGQIHWDEVKLFEREIAILQRLNHPALPSYVDDFTLEQPHFQKCLVESYIHAPSLQAFLDRRQAIPQKQVWAIAAQILTILQYLHQQEPPVLHRDIKPSNILIDRHKTVYLIDLGSTGLMQETANNLDVPTTVGSYGYTPMEQFMGQASPASDLYALGATLLQLLTQTAPADLMSSQLRLLFPPGCDISLFLKQWVYQLTSPQANERFQSSSEALQALNLAQDRSQSLEPSSFETRLQVTRTASTWNIHLAPRWNSQTLSRRDLALFLGLLLLPIGVGAVEVGQAWRVFQGFTRLGTEFLVVSFCLLPIVLVTPKLWRQLIQQTLEINPLDSWRVQRSITNVPVANHQFEWLDLACIQISQAQDNQWNLSMKTPSATKQMILQDLSVEDLSKLYLAIEDCYRDSNE